MKLDWEFTCLLIILALAIMAASVMASSLTSTSTYTNPDGLIGYWDFAQCTGTSATDRGDWGQTGTLTGSPTWVAGKYGCGINFIGSSYVHAGNNSILNPSAITISVWAYRTGTDALVATYTIITKNNGGGAPYYGIGIYGGTMYATSNGNPVLNYGTESSVLPLNTWVHLAMTEDGSTLKIYVNGVLTGSQSSAMTGASTTNLSIGGGAAPLSFAGILDEPKIWNRALSPSEIYEDYLGTYGKIEEWHANVNLNQTMQTSSNVGGTQQWLNFQILLLIMALCFLGFGIWRHNNLMISAGSIILILLALSIYSDGINAGVSNVTQNGNYTYNGYSQLSNITSSDVYTYATWKDATSNGIALLLAVFGSGLFIYSAIYVPWEGRERK